MNKLLPLILLSLTPLSAQDNARILSAHGFDNCIEIKNAHTRVVLCPEVGGRVLEYSMNKKQALPLPDKTKNKKASPAGRFDIGPELTIPKRPALWSGTWTGKITGPRSAALTSPISEATGVQLIRTFTLAPDSTKLTCTQAIKNISNNPVAYNHWSRTFAQGQGIVYLPQSSPGTPSRFPGEYAMYLNGTTIDVNPSDPNIRIREGFIEILGPPENPKLGFDSYAGWMAYHMPNDLLFFKQYDADPQRVYGEAAGLTASVWYPDFMSVVELEPIGPLEHIAPGEQASFTETWYLHEAIFRGKESPADLQALRATAEKLFD